MLIEDVLREKGHEVTRIGETETVRVAVEKLAERRIGALVVESQWLKMVGIFSERDLLRAIAAHGAAALDTEVRALMTSPIVSCPSSTRVDEALATMTLKKIRHLPVVDDGELRGIVSIGDLVKVRMDEKELEANVLLEISRMRR